MFIIELIFAVGESFQIEDPVSLQLLERLVSDGFAAVEQSLNALHDAPLKLSSARVKSGRVGLQIGLIGQVLTRQGQLVACI